eukprot:326040-Pelagomonas_calceolata.AAC.2
MAAAHMYCLLHSHQWLQHTCVAHHTLIYGRKENQKATSRIFAKLSSVPSPFCVANSHNL